MLLRQTLCRTALLSRSSVRSISSLHTIPRQRPSQSIPQPRPRAHRIQTRSYVAKPTGEVEEHMRKITEQYATARDEFEIAAEETEKKTVYAADDRAAAAEELEKLRELYEGILKDSSPEIVEEIKQRAGQRVRELSEAIKGLEASAIESD